MKILALEFSSAERSVALVETPGLPQPRPDSPVESGPWQESPPENLEKATVLGYAVARLSESIPALHLVERVLREARVEREAVECLAIGLGPGSYTGIRSAVAMAQGWQLGCGILLLGIGSMECLAASVFASRWKGRLGVTVDAQRGELYLALYEMTAAGCRLVEPLKITRPDSLAALADARIIGPEASRWTPSGEVAYPDARMLGQLAAMRTGYLPGEKLEPIYLREASFVKAPPPRTLPPLPER